eukprot:SAG22_NODE_958_length_6301_cov_4.995324_3_plen_76_part_00
MPFLAVCPSVCLSACLPVQIVFCSGRPADCAFNTVNQISFLTPTLAELKRLYAVLKGRTDITQLLTVTHGAAGEL